MFKTDNPSYTKNLKLVALALIIFVVVICTCVVIVSNNQSSTTVQVLATVDTTNAFDEVVSSVYPEGSIGIYEDETLEFEIIALSGAKMFITMADDQYYVIEGEQSGEYSTYSVTITMPSTQAEVEAIGEINLTVTYGGQLSSSTIASISYGESEVTTTSSSDKLEVNNNVTSSSNTTVNSGNASAYTTTTQTIVTSSYSSSSIVGSGSLSQLSGYDVCQVTAEYADVRLATTSDTNSVPYLSTLAKSTMDYVVGEISVYDSSEGEYVDFYNLASGLRIKKEDAQIVSTQSLDYNTMEIISSTGINGELSLTFKTDWQVPYSFSFDSQNYYTAYGESYNVSSFDASTLTFTFYYTTSLSGTIDVSGSDVVSSASVSTSVANETVTITMPLITKGEYFGYTISYDSNGYLVLTINNQQDSLINATIVLDPGHGGTDCGALGLHSTVYESTVNLILAAKVKEALEAKGATVYLTRYSDEYVSLTDRKTIGVNYNADIFVSIHANGSENTDDYGLSAYYYKGMSQSLATEIYDELFDAFYSVLYDSDPTVYNDINDGVRYYPFSVTRMESCPSVLLEVGYMSNFDECAKIIDSDNSDALAQAIADGIENYFNLYS